MLGPQGVGHSRDAKCRKSRETRSERPRRVRRMIGRDLVDARPQVIMLPGAVLPADLAYGALLEALGDAVEAVAKELEIYAGEEPPPRYAHDVEIEGILRAAEAS